MHIVIRLVLLYVIAMQSGCSSSSLVVDRSFESEWKSSNSPAGVYLIANAPDALAFRIDKIRKANTSVNITYFSWNKDVSGVFLFNELLAAANKGVNVRVVIDDSLFFDEGWLVELNSHQNIDIKLFNPFTYRKLGWLGRAVEFQSNKDKLNHRLHEKFLSVDGKVMFLGGRNIGDDYFSYNANANFFDLDIIVNGESVSIFDKHFEALWLSEFVSLVSNIIDYEPKGKFTLFNKLVDDIHLSRPAIINNIEWRVVRLPSIKYIPATVFPIFDSLDKNMDSLPYFRKRIERFLLDYEGSAKKEIIISTPYALPAGDNFEVITAFYNNGADVTLVTNSSSSNDSSFVPAYYSMYREDLLNLNVNIYEYKDNAVHAGSFYHSTTHYHNKTFIMDRKLTYIGSSNFDPRSDFLNIEFGLMIESEEFASEMVDYILQDKDDIFWNVSFDDEGKLIWSSNGEVSYNNPNYSIINTMSDALYRLLRIKPDI
ncbi:phospholipase D family protein [Shewanella olleyana]|uniref:phospholipase D-like domain-containing protein n=1 Tax=Shewanella olleyana TaxID=135626 RepID=UPI00200ED8F1|nr:phospholipase D family protein [Shewanella olleyana]MCL1067413.1 phospholipase D family protein [Shewanella olleyana]